MQDIQNCLFALRDAPYAAFTAKLIPNIDPKTVIGVRTPALKTYAKDLSGTDAAAAFMRTLPHAYFEENNLHGFLIARIKDFDACVLALERFLPYINNWSTCDQTRPAVFKKHTDALYPFVKKWMASNHTYTVRFGIGMLMTHYLDEHFSPRHLALVAGIGHEDYYVQMMVAWYFATALAKQYDETLPFIERKALPPWTHNKAIQKAIESYRVTNEHKAALRALKV